MKRKKYFLKNICKIHDWLQEGFFPGAFVKLFVNIAHILGEPLDDT